MPMDRYNLYKNYSNMKIRLLFFLLSISILSIKGENIKPSVSGTLPVLYINVYKDSKKTEFDNDILDKDLAHKNYFSNAEYYLDLNSCTWMENEGARSIGDKEFPLPLEIKARGNWTRVTFSKKPFKIKLKEEQSLLGLSKSKHFALLAHADDCFGYLRNFVGFNLGKRINLPWTPSQQPVELVVNGDYRGLYFLTESIRVDEERINIAKLADNEINPDLISGGYVVEIDQSIESNQIVLDQKTCIDGHIMKDLRITWESPEEYSEIQKRFIMDQFTAINDAVGRCDDIMWQYLDLDDAVRYYLVREIMSDTEAYTSSTFLFRDRGEGQKWHFSPVWDCGQAFLGSSENFFYDVDNQGNIWIPSIRTNEKFNQKLKDTWIWFMNAKFNGIFDDISLYVDRIRDAAVFDFIRWSGQPIPEGGLPVYNNSNMENRKDIVVEVLNRKINWLKEQFGDYERIDNIKEPERDTTPATPLPDYATSDNSIILKSTPDLYFSLQGIRISNPKNGTLYIQKKGNKVYKVIYRD